MRGGNFPLAYVYPAQMCATRDLLRRRMYLMRERAAVLFQRGNEPAQKYVDRLARKHGKGKAITILAHRLGRTVYHMLQRGEAFDSERFLSTT